VRPDVPAPDASAVTQDGAGGGDSQLGKEALTEKKGRRSGDVRGGPKGETRYSAMFSEGPNQQTGGKPHSNQS